VYVCIYKVGVWVEYRILHFLLSEYFFSGLELTEPTGLTGLSLRAEKIGVRS
jgi:hypothetical protein